MKKSVVVFDEIINETDLAYLFLFDEDEIWLPKSQIENMDEDKRKIGLSDWLIEEHGLENCVT